MRGAFPLRPRSNFTRRGLAWLEPFVLLATVVFALFTLWLNLREDAPQVNESARVIATDLLWARSEAVRLGGSVTLSFSGDAYEVSRRSSEESEPEVLLRRDLSRSFPLVGVAPSLLGGSVTFDVRGLSAFQQAGVIALTSVQDSSFQRCVRLSSEGQVSFEAVCASPNESLLALER